MDACGRKPMHERDIWVYVCYNRFIINRGPFAIKVLDVYPHLEAPFLLRVGDTFCRPTVVSMLPSRRPSSCCLTAGRALPRSALVGAGALPRTYCCAAPPRRGGDVVLPGCCFGVQPLRSRTEEEERRSTAAVLPWSVAGA